MPGYMHDKKAPGKKSMKGKGKMKRKANRRVSNRKDMKGNTYE